MHTPESINEVVKLHPHEELWQLAMVFEYHHCDPAYKESLINSGLVVDEGNGILALTPKGMDLVFPLALG